MRVIPDNWYALGKLSPRGGWIKVRKLVSGRLMARYEKRSDEVAIPVEVIPRAKSASGYEKKRAAGKKPKP